jgi:NAD(P)-dependent dehydrogenase (short-subunit alcohol dehydrogenase family)
MRTGHTLIIGGSSGMGYALAERLLADGVRVTIAGRSTDKLTTAARRLGSSDRLGMAPVDIGADHQVQQLLARLAPLQAIVVTAADAAGTTGPLADLHPENACALLRTKVVGPWLVARHARPHLDLSGSITFTAGVSAHRPGSGRALTAAANAAVEGLVRALALELAPIRVNAVSPGWTDTPMWTVVAGDGKAAALAGMAQRLPTGRVGRPEDIADAIVALMGNGFITGTVLPVDGGQRLV